MNIHWKDWCWSLSSSTLATWFKEQTHWKRPWCWERWKAKREGGSRGWDGQTASTTQWTWIWANSGKWWRTEKPGLLQSVALPRVGQDSDWATNWSTIDLQCCVSFRCTAKWSGYTYIYIYILFPENGLKWSCFEVDWPSKTILYWFEMTCHFTTLPWGLKERAGGTVLSFGKSKCVFWPKVQASPSMWGLKFRQRKRTLGTRKDPSSSCSAPVA